MEIQKGKLSPTLGRRDCDLVPCPYRLEKEYAAMKSKEMEEQIEIKVSSRGMGEGTKKGAIPA